MALSDLYIPITLINQYFVDKDSGLPLSGGTLRFWRDTARSTPKPVYQLVLVGSEYQYVAITNPVELSASGTCTDGQGNNIAVYAYPYINNPSTGELELDLYFLQCYSSDDVWQFDREAIPSISAGNTPIDSQSDHENMLSNPQFTNYFLQDASSELDVSGSQISFPIAPDWELVASGTGSVLISRIPVSGNEALPTYPAYYLSVTVGAGISSCFLRQRLHFNSGLWSDQYLSGFVVAQAVGIGSNALTMYYKDASGVTSNVEIFAASLTNTWAAYGGSTQIGSSSNTLSGDSTYVDVIVNLPISNTIEITSIQVKVASTADAENLTYDPRSANREQALMGDYYIPNQNYKNVPSLAQCWDFPKNPRQFGASGTVTSTTAAYIWDQTILQTSNLTVTYGTNTLTNGLNLTHGTANQAFSLIQYLDQQDAAKFVGTNISVNINGYTQAGGNSAQASEVVVNLFACSSATQFGTLPTTIVNLTAAGVVSLTATAVVNGWYEIPRSNLPVARGTLSVLNPSGSIASAKDVGFNGWAITDNAEVSAGVQGVAIVVTIIPFAGSTDYKTSIDSIGVIPGNLPCRPAPESYEKTLLDAQRYWEQSFDGTSANTFVNEIIAYQNSGLSSSSASLGATFFSHDFETIKRVAPTILIYSPSSGTVDNVLAIAQIKAAGGIATQVSLSTNWTQNDVNTRRFSYFAITATSLSSQNNTGGGILTNPQAYIAYHFTADARLGLI